MSGSQSASGTLSKIHLPWIDWLRFLAALVVFLGHARGTAFTAYGQLDESSKNAASFAFFFLTRFGHESVILFFVLSGYFVGGRALKKAAEVGFQVSEYFVDRFTRIYLPYLCSLALLAVWHLLINRPVNLFEWLGNAFALQGVNVSSFGGNAPLWSLSYEIWLYVAAGSVAAIVSGAKGKIYFCLLFIFSVGMLTLLEWHLVLCWIMGVLVYLIRPRNGHWVFLLASLVSMVIFGVFSLLASESLSFSIPERFRVLANYKSLYSIIFSLFSAVFISQISFITPRSGFTQKMDAVGTRLASFSFSLYLTHYPILNEWSNLGVAKRSTLNVSSIVYFTVLCLACLLFAWGFSLATEKQSYRLRIWIKRRVGISPRI